VSVSVFEVCLDDCVVSSWCDDVVAKKSGGAHSYRRDRSSGASGQSRHNRERFLPHDGAYPFRGFVVCCSFPSKCLSDVI